MNLNISPREPSHARPGLGPNGNDVGKRGRAKSHARRVKGEESVKPMRGGRTAGRARKHGGPSDAESSNQPRSLRSRTQNSHQQRGQREIQNVSAGQATAGQREQGKRQRGKREKETSPRTSGTSLNHLLNFRFESDLSNTPMQRVRSRRKVRGPTFKKEVYMSANCHFVLSPGDHAEALTNADHIVDWNRVEQVIYFGEQPSECPICLSPPLAPKITKCGHIFCFPCLLRYLDTAERSWARCPLCFESVYLNGCKSTVLKVHPPLTAGDEGMFFSHSTEPGVCCRFCRWGQQGQHLRQCRDSTGSYT